MEVFRGTSPERDFHRELRMAGQGIVGNGGKGVGVRGLFERGARGRRLGRVGRFRGFREFRGVEVLEARVLLSAGPVLGDMNGDGVRSRGMH